MGYTLPGGSPSPLVLRTRGSTYLDAAYEPLITGVRTSVLQDDAWPRAGAFFNCVTAIPDDLVPNLWITASYRAAYLEAVTPGILSSGSTGGPRVKRQKVDVIEREFFDDGATIAGGANGFVDPTIDGMVRAFICDDSGGFFFTSIGS